MIDNNLIIEEVNTNEALELGFQLMKQLRTTLEKENYINLLEEMKKEGYKNYALYLGNKMVALAGIVKLTNLYYGKHIWVDDLVTHEDYRGQGYGEKLLSYIEIIGREIGCENIALSSGIPREEAHNFYEKHMNFSKTSFVFVKPI